MLPNHTPTHTRKIFNPPTFQSVCEWAIDQIIDLGNIEAIAACGHSGLPLAGALSYALGLHLIAVRRQGDMPIGDKRIINTSNGTPYQRYVIVDDLVHSGKTMMHMIQQIHNLDIAQPVLPTAILLYEQYRCPNTETLGRIGNEYFPFNQQLHRAIVNIPFLLYQPEEAFSNV